MSFDPHFLGRHPLLWPLERAARPFGGLTDWPAVPTWGAVFDATIAPPIGFTIAAPRPRGGRRRRAAQSTPYDVSIIERGLVPSRERHWHDFLNALVWGTFPRAKAALHRRQNAMVTARLDPELPGLPPHRTREQDGLAMIDEGGVIALLAPSSELKLVFGHAVYESFVLGLPDLTARLVRLTVPALAADPIQQADAALAATLANPAFSTLPDDLPRVFVPETLEPSWRRPA